MENIMINTPIPSRHSVPDFPPEDRGPWAATSRGRLWSIFDPHPAEVSLEDISAGLARNCRYSGQISRDFEMYSVAEHSVLMTEWAIGNGAANSWEDAVMVLLHDGSESICGDMITPMKKLMPEFRKVEDRAQAVIQEAFGLHQQDLEISRATIKMIDIRIRLDERAALINEPASSMGTRMEWDGDGASPAPLGVRIEGLLPRAAQDAFLECYLDICARFEPRAENLDVRDSFMAEARQVLGYEAEAAMEPGF